MSKTPKINPLTYDDLRMYMGILYGQRQLIDGSGEAAIQLHLFKPAQWACRSSNMYSDIHPIPIWCRRCGSPDIVTDPVEVTAITEALPPGFVKP